MAQKDCIPYGSDVSAGTYRCQDCGHEMSLQSASSLPPCPNDGDGSHSNQCWATLSGQGDASEDPYPGS